MFKVMFVSTITGMLVSGAAVGAFQERRIEHAMSMFKRDFRPSYDPDGNFYWAGGSLDSQIANTLKQTAMDGDSASVFESMAASQPKPKRRK